MYEQYNIDELTYMRKPLFYICQNTRRNNLIHMLTTEPRSRSPKEEVRYCHFGVSPVNPSDSENFSFAFSYATCLHKKVVSCLVSDF